MSPRHDKKRTELILRKEDAGKDLDRQIEGRVASLLHRSPVPWKHPPNYTLDVDRARFLLDVAERREGARTAVAEVPTGWACSFDYGGEDDDLVVGRGDTEALAICAAFMSRKRRRGERRFRGGVLRAAGRGVKHAARRVGKARLVRRLGKAIRNLLFP